MVQTKWVRQARLYEKKEDFVVTLKKRGFSLNAALMAELTPKDRFAEILISEDNAKIAFVFTGKETEWSFKLSNAGPRATSRMIEASALIARNRNLTALVGEGGEATKIRVVPEDGMYVGDIEPTFCYDGTKEPAGDGDIGVFRLFVGSDVVLIGGGRIKPEISKLLSENLPFDRYDYFLTGTEITAFEHQARIMNKFRAEHNGMPLLNQMLARKNLDAQG